MAKLYDQENEEKRRSRMALIVSLSLLTFLGLGIAGFQFYQKIRTEKRFLKNEIVENQGTESKTFYEVKGETDDQEDFIDYLEKQIKAFYSEGLTSNRIPLIENSGLLAGQFENFYVRNSDELDTENMEIEAVYKTSLSEAAIWLMRVKTAGGKRDFVFKLTEEGIRIDWEHMVAKSSENWESFLKSEVPKEGVFRVYAWLIDSDVNEGVILLRMAAPLFTGMTGLSEVTPILRVPLESEVGERIVTLFEELPQETDEIGFPQGPRVDDKMRQLTVRLRTDGQVKKQPALTLLEIPAGDWVSLSDEDREKVAVYREELESISSDDIERAADAVSDFQVPDTSGEEEDSSEEEKEEELIEQG